MNPFSSEAEVSIPVRIRVAYNVDREDFAEIDHIKLPKLSGTLTYEQRESVMRQLDEEIKRVRAKQEDNSP